MDFTSLCVILFPHFQIDELYEIIYQYSLPPSLQSYGISFDSSKHLPNLTCYFKLTSLKESISKKETIPTPEIMNKIFDIICCVNHMKYVVGEHTLELRGDTFILDAVLVDPRGESLRGFRLNYQAKCISCGTSYPIMGSDFCSYCVYSSGGTIQGYDMTVLYDMDRKEKEEEIVDEEIIGRVYVPGGDQYFFTLTCVWSEFSPAEEDKEDKHYEGWENDIQSLPLIHQRTIVP